MREVNFFLYFRKILMQNLEEFFFFILLALKC